jgi:hypothetical protein
LEETILMFIVDVIDSGSLPGSPHFIWGTAELDDHGDVVVVRACGERRLAPLDGGQAGRVAKQLVRQIWIQAARLLFADQASPTHYS